MHMFSSIKKKRELPAKRIKLHGPGGYEANLNPSPNIPSSCGQGDDGRCVLLEGGIDGRYSNGLNSGRWLGNDRAQLVKHVVVEHGRLSFLTDLGHDGHCLHRVLAWKDTPQREKGEEEKYSKTYFLP